MNILYHHRTLLDGAEGIHIREMIHAFETLGHTVIPVSPVNQGSERAGRVPTVLRRLLTRGLFELAAAAYSVSEWRAGRRVMRDTRADLLYKRHALNDVGMLKAARDCRVPSVLEVNVLYSSESLGQFEPLRLPRLARATERKALELADLVVTVSSPLKALVYDIAPCAGPVIVLPNGVDAVRFNPRISGAITRAHYRLPETALVVGWCGIMRSWHGLDLLLQAIEKTTCWLLLIGDGPERARVERMSREIGIADRVVFAGRVPAAAVPEHLAAIDIGVVADDLTRYASPMKLLEYMAMAKPVVAPDLPNIRDVISDGAEGLLFEPGSAASLAQRLATLQNASASVRGALGTRGRLRVEAERNWTANARLVLSAVAEAGAAG